MRWRMGEIAMEKYMDFNTYKQLQKMSYNDMNRFAMNLYMGGFSDASEKCMEVLEEELKKIHGIGEKTTQKIMQHMKQIEVKHGN